MWTSFYARKSSVFVWIHGKHEKKIKKEKIVIARIMTNVRIKVKRISDSIYTETTKNKHGT